MWMVAAGLGVVGVVISAWHLRPDLGPVLRRSSGTSLALLFAYTAATSITFQVRDDRSALFADGLSSQNRVQAGVVLVLAGWAFFLITSRRVPISEGFTSARIWVTLLVCWYAVAVVWAITPTLSLYRALELGTLWILSMHAFADPLARRRLLLLMAWMVLLGAVSAVVWNRSLDIFSPGAIRSNSLAPVAAILGLFALDSLLRRGISPRRSLGLAVAVWLFLAFDSLATAGALLVALGVFFTLRVRSGRMRGAAMTGVAMAAVAIAVEPRLTPGALLAKLGGAYGREDRLVENWTGRVPLWQFMLDDVRDHPLGFGLGADRSIALRDATRSIGWEPLHAHSGYMSALYAGGLFALVLVVALVMSAFRSAKGQSAETHSLAFGVLTLLAFNNLTIVGFGGVASTSWLVMMAIIASSARVFGEPDIKQSVRPTVKAKAGLQHRR